MKKKLLVTGSCGFVFSNFIRQSVKENQPYDIISIDKVTKPENLHNIYANRSHKFYLGDISDKHFVETIFKLEQPDVIIHGAAEAPINPPNQPHSQLIKSNIGGTQVLIESALKSNVERFIYISTGRVYDQLKDNDQSSLENSQLHPYDFYSATKVSGEMLVKAASKTYGLNYNITRSCNIFGPKQSYQNLIPKVIRCILNKEKIPVYDQGLQIRDWMHVADNCSAIFSILDKAPTNQTYNISSGCETTNLELVNDICNIMELGHDLISFVDKPSGYGFRYSVDNNKIKSLGWKPTFKFKDGLKHTVRFYLKNKWLLR